MTDRRLDIGDFRVAFAVEKIDIWIWFTRVFGCNSLQDYTCTCVWLQDLHVYLAATACNLNHKKVKINFSHVKSMDSCSDDLNWSQGERFEWISHHFLMRYWYDPAPLYRTKYDVLGVYIYIVMEKTHTIFCHNSFL